MAAQPPRLSTMTSRYNTSTTWSQTAGAGRNRELVGDFGVTSAGHAVCAPIVGDAVAANHGVDDDLLGDRVQELLIVIILDAVGRWGRRRDRICAGRSGDLRRQRLDGECLQCIRLGRCRLLLLRACGVSAIGVEKVNATLPPRASVRRPEAYNLLHLEWRAGRLAIWHLLWRRGPVNSALPASSQQQEITI